MVESATITASSSDARGVDPGHRRRRRAMPPTAPGCRRARRARPYSAARPPRPSPPSCCARPYSAARPMRLPAPLVRSRARPVNCPVSQAPETPGVHMSGLEIVEDGLEEGVQLDRRRRRRGRGRSAGGPALGGAARPDAREDGVGRARLERHPSMGPPPISRRPRPRRPDGHDGRGRRRPGRGHGRARFDPRARNRGRIRTTPRRAASARRNSSEDPPGRAAEHHNAEYQGADGGHRAGSRPGSEERR